MERRRIALTSSGDAHNSASVAPKDGDATDDGKVVCAASTDVLPRRVTVGGAPLLRKTDGGGPPVLSRLACARADFDT